MAWSQDEKVAVSVLLTRYVRAARKRASVQKFLEDTQNELAATKAQISNLGIAFAIFDVDLTQNGVFDKIREGLGESIYGSAIEAARDEPERTSSKADHTTVVRFPSLGNP
jgi:hypothetical protein